MNDKIQELANFVFEGVLVDADVRNFVRMNIYPKHLELSKLNLRLFGEVIDTLVWRLDHNVWFDLDDDVVKKYSLSSSNIKIHKNNCKATGFSEDFKTYLVDISINGKPTLVEIPIVNLLSTTVEIDPNKVHVRVSDILKVTVGNLVDEFSDEKPKTTIGDMMEKLDDNIVHVDFKNKTIH